MAEGVSEVAGLHHVDRGYENIAGQLQSLGARVVRLETGGWLLNQPKTSLAFLLVILVVLAYLF